MDEQNHDDRSGCTAACRNDGAGCAFCCRAKFKTINPARFGKAPEPGDLGVCRFCGDLVQAYRGHGAGRCSWTDDLNALLGKIGAAAQGS